MTKYTKEQVVENRETWIKALESGDYTQARGALCKYDSDGAKIGHCCLGVATELFDPGSDGLIEGVYRDSRERFLNDNVVDAIGLYSFDGLAVKIRSSLTMINDESHNFAPVIKAIKTGEYWKPLEDLR